MVGVSGLGCLGWAVGAGVSSAVHAIHTTTFTTISWRGWVDGVGEARVWLDCWVGSQIFRHWVFFCQTWCPINHCKNMTILTLLCLHAIFHNY